jgi:hypothetical protein
MLSLFFVSTLPGIFEHLQSAFYDSNKKNYFHRLGLVHNVQSKKKPPQLNSGEGLGFGF